MLAVEITPVNEANRSILENLFQFYLYEFSSITDRDVAVDGRYHDASINDNILAPNHYSFLVQVEGQFCGFAIVEDRSNRKLNYTMRVAEFFVMRKYQRRGVGRQLAILLFDRFPGRWKVAELANNQRAIDFWRSVINEYTNGRYEESIIDPDAVIQYFDSYRN